ncbi:MAG TPA: hypothetical protein VNS59_02865 [Lysobacter sp.]|jgi:hypothetical protein|nr:hypothetical protein [Lysobacter sp.]
MKRVAMALLFLPLAGCGAGFNDDFTPAECNAFAAQYQALGGISDAVGEEGKAEIRERTVRDCKERTLGLSREEYTCAMKAGSRDEWKRCGIVLKG